MRVSAMHVKVCTRVDPTTGLDISRGARKPVQACAWSHPKPKMAAGMDAARRESDSVISRDMEKPT